MLIVILIIVLGLIMLGNETKKNTTAAVGAAKAVKEAPLSGKPKAAWTCLLAFLVAIMMIAILIGLSMSFTGGIIEGLKNAGVF